MSDKPFSEKQTMVGGFIDSNLRLNHNIASLSKWDGTEILNRSKNLGDLVVSIWRYPVIPQDDIDDYIGIEKVEPIYTSIDHYTTMNPQILTIYHELDRKIMSLDSGIRIEYKQQYIAYKMESNFVNIKPSKAELTIGLNIPFEELNDTLGICRDTTNVGNFANNPVLFKVNESNSIDYIIDLVKQALNYQLQ